MPRWEWRTFFPEALPRSVREQFRVERLGVEKTGEIYVLSLASPHNVKIREGRLEIKVLELAERGLERWRPTLRAPFPVSVEDLHAVFEAWGIPAPVLARRHTMAGDFLGDIVWPVSVLRVVHVQKERFRLTIQGCAAERSLLDIDGRRWETIAIEDADPDRLLEAIATLHLAGAVNTSYPAALKTITGVRSRSEG